MRLKRNCRSSRKRRNDDKFKRKSVENKEVYLKGFVSSFLKLLRRFSCLLSNSREMDVAFEAVVAKRVDTATLRGLVVNLTSLWIAAFVLNAGNGLFWLKPATWPLLVAVVGVFVAFGRFVVSKHVAVTPSVVAGASFPWSKALSPPLLKSFCVHAICGGVLARSYLGLVAASSTWSLNLLVDVDDGVRRLNESHLFLVLSGVFSGACLWRDFHFGNRNLLVFEVIERKGWAQLRSAFKAIFRHSAINAALNLRWFVLAYVAFGRRIALTLATVMRLHSTTFASDVTEDSWLWSLPLGAFGTLWSLFQVRLIFWAVLLNLFIYFSVSSAVHVHLFELKRRLKFEIEGAFNLCEALNAKKNPLLRHLAFIEFSDLTLNAPELRQQLYKLSQPGGHPRNFKGVSDAAINVIEDFTQELVNASKLFKTTGSNYSGASLTASANTSAISANLRLRTHLISSQAKTPSCDGQAPNANVVGKVGNCLAKIRDKIALFIKMSSVSSAHHQYADQQVRTVFGAYGQLVISAVESLSQLAAAAVAEDRFGVVQRDLNKIITTMIGLQQTVERHKGLTTSLKRSNFEIRDVQLKQELRDAIKTALFRTCAAYGDSLRAIRLPDDVSKQLINYTQFIE